VSRTNLTFVVPGTTPPFSIEEDYSAGTGAGVELKAVTDRCADRDSSLTGTWRRAS
jgi:hypothetical protein